MTVIHIGATMISAEATIKFDNDVETLKMLARQLLEERNEMYELLDSIENDAEQVPVWLWDKIQSTLAKARGEK